jgi:hypothetical protein
MMSLEQSMEWGLAGETEVLGENLLQRHFAHHKSHMNWPGIEPGPSRWEANDYLPELWPGLRKRLLCCVCLCLRPYFCVIAISTFEPTKQFPLNSVRMPYHWRPPKRRRLDFPHRCRKSRNNVVKARTCWVGALLVPLSSGSWHDG